MAQEAEEQPVRDAMAAPGLLEAAAQPREHGGEGDAARGVALRIEEDLGVHHALRVRLVEIGLRQVPKIPGVAQHGGAGVVHVEELLQVREPVCAAQVLDARVGEHDAVLRGEPEGELRLEGALDVDVEFGLGQPPDIFLGGLHETTVSEFTGQCLQPARHCR